MKILTTDYIKKLRSLPAYGTFADRRQSLETVSFRTKPAATGLGITIWLLLQALRERRNKLQRIGKYTDPLDEVIIKLGKANKRIRN